MTRELAMVHAREGIRLNSICPYVLYLNYPSLYLAYIWLCVGQIVALLKLVSSLPAGSITYNLILHVTHTSSSTHGLLEHAREAGPSDGTPSDGSLW